MGRARTILPTAALVTPPGSRETAPESSHDSSVTVESFEKFRTKHRSGTDRSRREAW